MDPENLEQRASSKRTEKSRTLSAHERANALNSLELAELKTEVTMAWPGLGVDVANLSNNAHAPAVYRWSQWHRPCADRSVPGWRPRQGIVLDRVGDEVAQHRVQLVDQPVNHTTPAKITGVARPLAATVRPHGRGEEAQQPSPRAA